MSCTVLQYHMDILIVVLFCTDHQVKSNLSCSMHQRMLMSILFNKARFLQGKMVNMVENLGNLTCCTTFPSASEKKLISQYCMANYFNIIIMVQCSHDLILKAIRKGFNFTCLAYPIEQSN